MNTLFLFFTGMGGVGKTSLACASAVELADSGKTVLLVSTDPASNLKEVLESQVDENINPVKGIDNLFAININPESSAEGYRNRVIEPYFQKSFLVSLPETTPMREAASLQDYLQRAGIKPYSWLINHSLSMLAGLSDPLLKSRARAELQMIDTIKTKYAERTFGIPFIAEKELLPVLLEGVKDRDKAVST